MEYIRKDRARRLARISTSDKTRANAARLLHALRDAHPDAMSKTDIRDYFGKHIRRDELDRALTCLEAQGLATYTSEPTRGRPKHLWTAVLDPSVWIGAGI